MGEAVVLDDSPHLGWSHSSKRPHMKFCSNFALEALLRTYGYRTRAARALDVGRGIVPTQYVGAPNQSAGDRSVAEGLRLMNTRIKYMFGY